MLYGRYTFSSSFLDEAVLPEYKGSTFRGVFGHSLKKVCCTLKYQNCQDCMLHKKCVYALTFETLNDEMRSSLTRVASVPHPYVIEPPEAKQTCYKAGDPFEFSLLLFGESNDYMPYYIYVFENVKVSGCCKPSAGVK